MSRAKVSRNDSMSCFSTLRFAWPALLLAVSLYATSSLAGANEPAMIVITAPSSSENTIPRSTLRAIFGMRLHKWPDGTPVKVYVFSDDASAHAAFSKEVLQVFPHQLRQAWDRLVFSGLGQYPEQVSSAQEMLDKVASTPGAIGYLRANEVNQNVRILQIR